MFLLIKKQQMVFNFKNTEIARAVKREKFILFRFSKAISNIFLALFVILFLAEGFYSLSFSYSATKTLILFLVLYLAFWNLNLFVELKIKKPKPLPINILERNNINIEDYNLAEFLDFEVARIISDAIDFCKRKRISVNSASLFYSAIKISKDVNLVCMRLGMDPKKLQSDIKNYLEKIQKHSEANIFSDDFKKTMIEAFKICVIRKHNYISTQEILVGLAGQNDFFRKTLVDYDLKYEDVQNLFLWLDNAQDLLEKSGDFWTYENLLREGSFGKNFSSGYTVTLDRFSIDWTKIVSKWKFREIIGHKREIDEAEVILAKGSSSNVLLVGEPGTGRKSIVQALAQKCYLGTSLPQLNNKRVVELDTVMLAAQISDFERLESTLEQIFSEVIASGNVILVIDDLDNFVGHKGVGDYPKAGVFDISGVLAKYLPLPNFQFIGITTYDGFHNSIEQGTGFANLFEKVEVSEVTEQETINILQTTALELEYTHKVLILYPSIREIVNLTSRYMPSLPFPKKALDVLNQSVAYVQKLKEKNVLPHHIAEIISKKTDIPVGKMDVKEKEVLLNLENLIHERIVNQAEAVAEVSIAMRRARMGLASKKRPMGTFLFLGPTGEGKTETAKALAQIYFGSEKKMIILDMSEFQAISDIPRLIGGPGDTQMQGLLTTPVRETPFSLILLDEIEKSHPNILNLFLQVLDEGRITDGHGRKVVFANTIIICTSNAAADMIFKQVETGQKLEKDKLLDALFERNIFRPEFVNRFDATVIFHPLTKDNLMKIAQLSLQSLKKGLEEKDINFEITESLKEKIVELSYKPEFGAREMRRVIQDKVENAIAEALLVDRIKKGDSFGIDPEAFRVIVEGDNN